MSSLRKGSRDDEVKRLQEALNQQGYNLVVDGVFGPNTEAAVRDYQKKSGLSVDGIVGKNTWGALSPATSTNPAASNINTAITPSLPYYEGNKPEYAQAPEVTDAYSNLTQQEQNKPQPFQSSYTEQLQQLYDSIMNREKFNYDFSKDPLYQQYYEQYKTLGQQAMMNTVGEVSALTGGYGSSYAQTAGQQTYNEYMRGATDIIPQLQQNAYNKYRDETSELYNQLSLTSALEQRDYQYYLDNKNDYYNELNYFYQKYRDMSADDYNKYLTDLNSWLADRQYYYNKEMDAAQLALQQQQLQLQYDQFEWQKQQASRNGGDGNDEGDGTSKPSGTAPSYAGAGNESVREQVELEQNKDKWDSLIVDMYMQISGGHSEYSYATYQSVLSMIDAFNASPTVKNYLKQQAKEIYNYYNKGK